jgi:hypothetical protein
MKIDGNQVVNFTFDVKVIFRLELGTPNYALISLCCRWVREPPREVGTDMDLPLP